MRILRIVLPVLMLLAAPARAAGESGDERFLGGALALVQQFVHLAAHSPDPQAAHKALDGVLAGRNAEANRLASGLMDEMLLDFPAEHRAAVHSIVRDLLVLARRERQRQGAVSEGGETERAARGLRNPPPAR
jgi:hypothetical protein